MEAVIVECRDSVPSQAGEGTLSSVRVLPAVFLRVTQVAQLLAVIFSVMRQARKNNGLLTEVKRHAARVLGEGRLHGEPQHQTETHPSTDSISVPGLTSPWVYFFSCPVPSVLWLACVCV